MILDTIDITPLDSYIKDHHIDVIISDIFDTILCRKLHPENIKKLVAARLTELFPEISESAFYHIRQNAELYCYEKSALIYSEREINYPHLICTMYELLKKTYGAAIFLTKTAFFYEHQLIELAIEYRNQIPDYNIINFLKKQKANGKKIILLSDFYMSSDLVSSMLTHHGISDFYDHLLVSSDVMKTKSSGRLYQAIIDNAMLRDPRNTLMIGDNYSSDIEMAKRFDLKTFYIQRNQQKAFYDNQQKLSFSKKALTSDINRLLKHQQNCVFEHLPLLILYTVSKLYNKCIKQGTRKLYFLSREGKIVKDLFDQYQDNARGKQLNDHPIATYYLLASRRSTAAASLSPITREQFTSLFKQYVNISIRQFSMSYGFDIEIINSICDLLAIDINTVHGHLPSSNCFKRLKKNKYFIQYYEDFRVQQRKNFLAYLHTLNISSADKELVLFDVGWKGSMQDNISKILPKKNLKGYYLGLLTPGALTAHNTKEGLLFDFRHKNQNYWIYRENLSLFETLLNADHGSVKKYSRDAKGELFVELDYEHQEKQLFTTKISIIHKQLYNNYTKILQLFDKYALSIQAIENYIAELHKEKVFAINKKEIDWFIDIQHFENFGLFNYSQLYYNDIKLAKTQIIKNFLRLLRSPRKYIRGSFWPFLKLSKDGLGFMALFYKWYLLHFRGFLKL